jgi:hypothetical protein
MNAKERKEFIAAVDAFEDAVPAVQALRDKVAEIAAREREKFDAKSERWRESEQGLDAEVGVDALEAARDSLHSACDELEGVDLAMLDGVALESKR